MVDCFGVQWCVFSDRGCWIEVICRFEFFIAEKDDYLSPCRFKIVPARERRDEQVESLVVTLLRRDPRALFSRPCSSRRVLTKVNHDEYPQVNLVTTYLFGC